MNIDINNYNISTLVDGCEQLNIELSEDQIKQFPYHFSCLYLLLLKILSRYRVTLLLRV